MESEESHIFHSLNLMIASLDGSLAHVTCKGLLRFAMVTHLKKFLQVFNVTNDVLNQIVSVMTNENLYMGLH